MTTLNSSSTSKGIHAKKNASSNGLSATSLPVILFVIAIVVVLSAVFHKLPWPSSIIYSDIVPFYNLAIQPGIFYINKPVEYPVITGLFIQFAGIVGKTPLGYYLVSSLLILVSALGSTYLLYRMAPDKSTIYRYWVLAPSMLIFAVYNWDLFAILFVTLAAFFLVAKHKNYLVSALLSLGLSIKLYPAMYLLPLIGKTKTLSSRVKIVWIFGLMFVVVNLPFAIINFQGWYYFFSFNNQRLPNPDSIWGVFHYYLPQLNVITINILSLLIFAFTYFAVLWRYRNKSILKLFFASTLIFLLCNKVFSPQYMLWILPFFVLTPVNNKGLFYSLEICNLAVLFTILPIVLGSSHNESLLFSSQIFVILRHGLLIYLLFCVLRSMREEKLAPVLEDGYLSVLEASKIIGVRPGVVKRLCKEGKLPAKMEHNTWLISSDNVHSFAKEYEESRKQPPSSQAK